MENSEAFKRIQQLENYATREPRTHLGGKAMAITAMIAATDDFFASIYKDYQPSHSQPEYDGRLLRECIIP